MSTYCASNKIYQIGLLQHNENTKWAGSTMRWVYNHTAAHSEEIFSPESDEKHMAHECAISHGPARFVLLFLHRSNDLECDQLRRANTLYKSNTTTSTYRVYTFDRLSKNREEEEEEENEQH